MAKNKNKYTMYAVDFNEQIKQIGSSATLKDAKAACRQLNEKDHLIVSVCVTRGDEIIWHIEQESKK